MRVINVSGLYMPAKALHQTSEKRRFPCPGFPGNNNKAFTSFDTVAQSGERFLIERIDVAKPRVGCETKRRLGKAKIFVVHDRVPISDYNPNLPDNPLQARESNADISRSK